MRIRRFLHCALFTIAAGCDPGAAPPGAGAEVSDALDTSALVTLTGVNPTPPMTGTFTVPAGAADSDPVCRGCAFTKGVNGDFVGLSRDIVHASSYPGADGALAPWQSAVPGLSAAYGDALAAAAAAIDVEGATAAAGSLELIASSLAAICTGDGACRLKKAEFGPAKPWARSFAPIYGRHLVRELVNDPALPTAVTHDYALPAAMGELRWRGGRSFCAMREAGFAAGGGSLVFADETLAHVPILEVDVGKVHSTLKLFPPQKRANAESQAYAIPMRIDANLEAVSGIPLVPEFGDISHPLVWITGDREVAELEDYGTVKAGMSCTAGICRQVWRNDYRKTYRDLEHVDVFAGASRTAHLEVDDIPIINLGLVTIRGGFTLLLESGVVDDADDLAKGAVYYLPSPSFAQPLSRTWLADVGLPPLARDAPFRPGRAGGTLSPVMDTTPDWGFAFPAPPALSTRWNEDDDRAIVLRDRRYESHRFAGVLGGSYETGGLGEITIEARGETTLTSTTIATLSFREALSGADGASARPVAAPGKIGQTNFVVTPRITTKANVGSLDVTLTLSWDVDLRFGTIHLSKTIEFFHWDGLTPTGAGGEIRGESSRLRVGEYTASAATTVWDGTSIQPSVYSHLPGASPFPAFPATVSSCLEDPRTPPPPAHGDEPGPGGDTRREASCFQVPVGNVQVPASADLCRLDAAGELARSQWAAAQISSGALSTGYGPSCTTSAQCREQQSWLAAGVKWACTGTSKRQWWKGNDTVARLESPAVSLEWATMLKAASRAFQRDGEGDAEAAARTGAFITRFPMPRACHPDGTLF